jgi:hypothetical protein
MNSSETDFKKSIKSYVRAKIESRRFILEKCDPLRAFYEA